jgi:hypothetical protein
MPVDFTGTVIEQAIDRAIQKAMALVFSNTERASEKRVAGDAACVGDEGAVEDSAEGGSCEDDDEYRNGHRGRLSWGPAKFVSAVFINTPEIKCDPVTPP